jgi:hypothetical protein
MMVTTPIRERLAALEHEQWAHWTRYLLDHLTPENVERWRRQIDTPSATFTATGLTWTPSSPPCAPAPT